MFKLQKDPQKPFMILDLTDPQLSDEEWEDGHAASALLRNTVDTLIAQAKPDLITVSGDVAWAGHMKSYAKFFDLLDSYRIPWAVVWGNHDNQGGAEQTDRQADLLLTHRYCLYEKNAPALGNGNYSIVIEENGTPVYAVIMMDSHDRAPYPGEKNGAYAYLLPEQLEWYRKESEAAGCQNAVILHIPIYAYRTAFETAWNKAYDPKTVTFAESRGGDCWNEGYRDSLGVQYEGIASYPEDRGEFDLIKQVGKTDVIIAGHDHVNNWMINYDGVTFVYGLKTGSGCYWNETLNGGTVLKIDGDAHTLEHIFVSPDGRFLL